MPPRLDRAFVYELYEKYGAELDVLRSLNAARSRFGGAYHKEERRILYMMVRHFQPELIVEFSPKRGLTTAVSALALEANGRGRILSFELNYRHFRGASDNLERQKLAHRVRFVFGDVREELPRALAEAGPDGLAFLFVDSDHGADFARWYLAALFPCVRAGGIVHIHDVFTDPVTPRESLPCPPNGEEMEVRRFIREHAAAYEWLSVGDCVHDPTYLDVVRRWGGGDVALEAEEASRPMPGDRQWNPSLWLRKRARQESDHVVRVPFEPIRRSLLKSLRHTWHRWTVGAVRRR